jgi:two-component system phosphate regulon sensor histidine kinase PhoR
LAVVLSATLVLAAGALLVLVLEQVSARVWSASSEHLRTEVLLLEDGLAANIETANAGEIQPRTVALGRALGIRITLITADGMVIADSEGDPRKMDNLATRPEIVAAMTEEFGTCHRMSPTLGIDALFVARAIRRDGKHRGWIRASVTAEKVTARIREVEASIFESIALAFTVAAALVALWMRAWPRGRSANSG